MIKQLEKIACQKTLCPHYDGKGGCQYSGEPCQRIETCGEYHDLICNIRKNIMDYQKTLVVDECQMCGFPYPIHDNSTGYCEDCLRILSRQRKKR